MTQENLISVPNKHIEKYLDYYFDGRKKLEYAVLLNGAWGSGKTWFVKKYIEKQISNGKKVAYISLNGISKSSEIDEAIFKCIHPVLGSKQAKLTGQILKGALKATLRIDLDGDSKADGSVNASVPDLKLPDYLKIDDNFILVFDDLERCEIKKEEVLGYINYFVEQENIKTLIVSNEEEIRDNDDYARKKEKLIGATFSYIEDQDVAIKSILQEVENEELRDILNSNFGLVRQNFNQVGYKNLRSFKQTILDFERFYKKDFFEWKNIFNHEIFEKVLQAFLILSLENKKGRFDKEILKFKSNTDEKLTSQDLISESLSGFVGIDAQDFKKKYDLNLKDYVFTQKLWNEILNLNIIDAKEVNKELYEFYFRFKEDQPIWFKLNDFLDLSEEEFNTLTIAAKESIEQNKLVNLNDILHTISILIYFKENCLIYFSVDNLLPLAISQLKQFLKLNEKIKRIEDYNFREQSGQYGFWGKGIAQFDSFMTDVMQAYEDKYVERNAERVVELLDLMESDSYKFYQLCVNEYYDYPIFNHFKGEDFVNRLCEIKSLDTRQVLYTLNTRYKVISSKNIYSQEKSWFDKVIQVTEQKLESSDRLVKAKINLKILPKLLEIRSTAYQGNITV